MLRKLQIKVVLIFVVIGVISITLLGAIFMGQMQEIDNKLSNSTSKEEMHDTMQEEINKTRIVFFSSLGVFCIIEAFIVNLIFSKAIIKPIDHLIKSSEKIAKGEEIETKGEEKKVNEVDELVNTFSNITTELKSNLNEVSRQKKQIEAILLHMTDGIIAFNKQGEIIHINPASKKFLEIEKDDNTFEKIFKKIDVDINMEKIMYLENWTSSEKRVSVKERYLNLFFAPFKDENDRPAGIIVLIQDVTEHVKLDNMRKEFVADVSHELKTPITSIMGYADTLLEGEYDKEVQEKFLGVIAGEARRMAKLVTDLLTLSRYDSNKVKLEESEFDLGELVKDCQEKLAVEINKKKHNVECFVTANVPPIKADKYGIERVVLNVLTNSIKYTKDGGHIKIYVGFVYNDAYVKIIDNGMGIPEKDLSRIFERFYRVDKARTREMGGTGLGLSIAKEILDQNGGSIDIKSIVGEGTEVVLRLPAKKQK